MEQSALNRDGTDIAGLWKRCLERIGQEIPQSYYFSIISLLRPLALDDGTLVVAAPNAFAKDVAESRFLPAISMAVTELSGVDTDIHITVSPSSETLEGTASPPGPAVTDAPAGDHPTGTTDAKTLSPAATAPGQRKRYTFENFVVGESNKFAYNAAIMVAEVPGHNYNPLFIYGGTGLGKTHLLFAIKDYAETLNPNIKVKYVQTSVFIDDFIATITLKRDKATFDHKYLNNKIVLFDDIQALSRTDATQDKFFDIFNILYGANSHIVISSDRPPREMSQLSDRIQSRFEGGLMIDIKPPDLETRLAILRMKSRAEGVEIPDDALIYIASNVDSNIRALEGLLNRVVASARLYGTRIDLSMVKDVLKDQLAEPNHNRVPTVDVIQSMVSSYYDIARADLVSKSRSQALVHGRQVAMYLCRELTNETLISIGNKFGDRDHSTVLHSCRKIESMLKERKDVLQEVRELTNMINKSG